ncbi:general substrate transporter [Infundibulicybe gibba]|nr:general substrate transporter [Infundibulicybe gibba]
MGVGPAIASGNAGYTHLIDNSKPWWKNRRLITLNLWIALLLITSSTNGYDGSMMNGLQSLTQWNEAFQHPTGGKLGLLNAIQNIGCLVAYPFAPYVSDGFGRRSSILFGAALMIVATALQTASNSVGMFIGARFLIGFGLTFAASAAPLLVTEIAFPSQRAQATSMYNTLWYLGSIIAAWTTFGTFNIQTSWSWRIPSAIQGLPSVLQICLIWFVPESPRWLVSKGKETQALKTLAYYHANGNEQDPLVEYEFEEIKAAIELDRTVAANVGWSSLFKSPGNRRRMRIIVALAFFSQWSGNGLVSYYLNKVFIAIGVTDPTTQLLINGILNIFNFVIAIIAGLLCDKIGRRLLFMISTIGMIVFWTLQTICFSLYSQHHSTAAGHTVISCITLFVGGFFAAACALIPMVLITDDIAFTPLIVSYSVEILPYAIRAKGFAVFNFAISLSLIFNQYVNPVALEKLGWKYYLVYVFWLTFEATFVYFFIIETKNRTLEETAALFDGDETVAQISEVAAEHAGIAHHSSSEKALEEHSEKGITEVVIN